MRPLLLVAVIAALTTAAAAAPKKAPAEQNWVAVCFGKDSQYMQTIGGRGYFHVSNGNRTYDTQKLLQSYYDGNLVCSIPDEKAPRANSEVAMVCADKTAKSISVLPLSETATKRVIPKNAMFYCKARIDVLE